MATPSVDETDVTKSDGTWYTFTKFYLGTDKQWAAKLVLLASILLVGCYTIMWAAFDGTESSSVYWSTVAVTGASILLLIASCLYVYLSYPAVFERTMESIKTENRPNLFFLAAVLIFVGFAGSFFVYPCMEVAANNMDWLVALIYLALVIVGTIGLGFLVFASTTDQLKQQNGRGNNYVFWLLSEVMKTMQGCCTDCCFNEGGWYNFWEGLLGSDFVIGFVFLLAVSLAVFAAAIVSVIGDFANLLMYVYLGAAALFVAGVFIMLYTSFPETHKSAIGWEILTFVFCCSQADAKVQPDVEAPAPAATTPAAGTEKEPLLKK